MKRLILIIVLAALLLAACAGGKPAQNGETRAVTLNLTYIRFMWLSKTAISRTKGWLFR